MKNQKKAYLGAIMSGISLGSSVINALGQRKKMNKELLKQQNLYLNQQVEQDKFASEDFEERDGVDIKGYYKYGGKFNTDPKNKKSKKVKDIKDATGITFTNEKADELFELKQKNGQGIDFNLGKYKDYFQFSKKNDEIILSNTQKNPHNADTVTQLRPYLESLNPNSKFNFEGIRKFSIGGDISPFSFNTIGGSIDRLSKNASLLRGNKHGQKKEDNTDGIDLKDKQGNTIINAEDNEVVKDNQLIYSDVLKLGNKTIAEHAKKLAKQNGKYEKSAENSNLIGKNTADRKSQINNLKLDKLFAYQENLKKGKQKNVKKAGLGEAIGKGSPYLDNIANLINTFTTPKIPKPILTKAANLKTDLNYENQKSDVKEQIDESSKFIANNTSNSSNARNEITKTRFKGLGTLNSISAQEENAETDLKNKDRLNKQQVRSVNNQKLDYFNQQNMQRRQHINDSLTANIADVAGDINNEVNNKRGQEYDKSFLEAIGKGRSADVMGEGVLLNKGLYSSKNSNDVQRLKNMFKNLGSDQQENFRKAFPNINFDD